MSTSFLILSAAPVLINSNNLRLSIKTVKLDNHKGFCHFRQAEFFHYDSRDNFLVLPFTSVIEIVVFQSFRKKIPDFIPVNLFFVINDLRASAIMIGFDDRRIIREIFWNKVVDIFGFKFKWYQIFPAYILFNQVPDLILVS